MTRARPDARARWLGATLALLAAGLPAALACRRDSDARAEAPPPVALIGPENVAVAERVVIRRGPALSGSLRPEREATVRAQIGGSVLEALAEAGQPVARGALLARIDAAEAAEARRSRAAALRSAEAALAVALRDEQRSERLLAGGAVAERDVEAARTAAASARAAVADARAALVAADERLRHTRVRAPFAGVVSEREVSAGDVVQTGSALFTVVDPTSMRLDAAVPAEALGALRVGTPVEFSVSGYADRTFSGRVARINPAVDPATRQVRLQVTLPNAAGSLVAGLFAEGRVATDARPGIVVPAAAVDVRGVRPRVVRLRAARVEPVEVGLGAQEPDAERVEVTSGLAEGDTVLLGGAQGLAPGTTARVRREQPAAGAAKGG